ncbi:MAG: nitroreductase [Frankiales bacterium]|nr:nitroreductase [Frankiales bacterium]
MSGDTSTDVWETMRTARAFRTYRPDPVSDETLTRCLEAATWAPSGGNQQPWRFVVLRSPEVRQALAVGAMRSLAIIEENYGLTRPAPGDDSRQAKMSRALFNLHEGAADVPAAVLFCTRFLPRTPVLLQGANIYPAMQNFLLAARATGLGTLVTGWHEGAPDELRAAVGVPEEWHLAGLVVAGWPKGTHGPVRRKPVAQVTRLDTWDQPLVAAG